MSWSWDETLYAGSASHYGVGRMPYPPELADALRAELGLDGTGRPSVSRPTCAGCCVMRRRAAISPNDGARSHW